MLAATFFVALGVVAIVSAVALLWYSERSLTRTDIPGLRSSDEGAAADAEGMTEVLNVLLVGGDSREGLSDEQLEALGTDRVDGGRTDTVMLLQLDPHREQAVLLSFPRDLLVTRCDGSRGRINAAYSIGEDRDVGGGACLVETVSEFTDIPIDHYVEVNFAGFIDVVDVLGGVSLYLEEPLRDRHAGLDLDAGCHQLSGTEALSFVRARHIDNDIGRMARQQRFIREVMQEVTSAGTLLNVPRLFSLVNAAGRAVQTDRDLSLGDMRRIAFSLRNLTAEQLDTRTVPSHARTINGAYYAVADEEEAEALFEAFRDGELVPPDLGRQPTQDVAVDDVPPLLVLNGVGTDGLAAAAAELLEERGFGVLDTANAEDFDVDTTEVVYPPQRKEEAELVAAVFPDAELVAGDDDEDLTVVLGATFDPDDVEAKPASPESPEPTAEPDEPSFQGAAPSRRRC